MDRTDTDVGVAAISGLITFAAAWIYCMSEYGFLFGFGLGWLPALILGAIIGLVMAFVWRFVAIGLALIAAAVFILSVRGG